MAKWDTKYFIEKAKEKHGDLYDYSISNYEGQEKDISFICPIHGVVTQKTKSHFVRTGCHLCDEAKAKKSRKSGKYAKQKGTNYELLLIKELKELGFDDCVSSRSESKAKDNMKIDIVSDQLPFYAQAKCTKVTPSYHTIEEGCPLKDKPYVLFWNRQEVKEGQINMSSRGEVVFVPKEFFYKLLKAYQN